MKLAPTVITKDKNEVKENGLIKVDNKNGYITKSSISNLAKLTDHNDTEYLVGLHKPTDLMIFISIDTNTVFKVISKNKYNKG